MKCLFVISNLHLPPAHGMQQGTWSNLQSLVKPSDENALISVTRYDNDYGMLAQLGKCRLTKEYKVGFSFFSQILSSIAFYLKYRITRTKEYKKSLTSNDFFFVEGITLSPLVTMFPKEKTVFSLVDAFSLRMKRRATYEKRLHKKFWLLAQSIIISKLEKHVSRNVKLVHVVSSEDAKYLNRIGVKNTISVPIPRGVSVFQREKYDSYLINFTGLVSQDYVFDSLVNFYREVFIKLKKNYPLIRLNVCCGKSKPDKIPEDLAADKSVNFVGWIDDYDRELLSSGLAILPDLCGTGIKNRAIDAARLGLPFVGTSIALEGTNFIHNESCFVADSPEEFIRFIGKLVDDKCVNFEIGKNAHHQFLRTYTTHSVRSEWDKVKKSVMS